MLCANIMNSGPNKGKVCNKTNCNKHIILETSNVIISNIDTCKSIIKSGTNKGKECGKIQCKFHLSSVKGVEIKEVEVEKVEVEKVVVKEVKVEKAEVEKAEVEKVEIKKVEIKKVEVKKVEIKKVEVKKVEIENSLCKSILKSGINKGKECGKNNCKIHKKEDTLVIASLVSLEPIVLEPVALEPVALEPVALEPVVLEPVALEPVALEPVALEPVALEKVVLKPLALEPVQTGNIEHRISILERNIKKIKENVINSIEADINKCSKIKNNRCCGNYTMNGYTTCFIHTIKNPNNDDVHDYSLDEIDEDMRFCEIVLTAGKFKGFRCGNECLDLKNVCVYHEKI